MRSTLHLAEDALIAAQTMARRQRMSLGDAVSEWVRRGASVPPGGLAATVAAASPLRGRFALLPARDEVIRVGHVRAWMGREGV
jgi:hypothetical protein